VAPHIEEVLLYSLAQAGDRYVFGAEVDLDDPNPDVWDCSELVQWSCWQADVAPTVPDGSRAQWAWIQDRGVPLGVSMAIHTRGALLFGTTAGIVTHVAWSLGDGSTIEARGSRWGVGCWPATDRRFTYAGLLPGIDYSIRPPLTEDDFMQTHEIHIEQAGMHEARPPFGGGFLAPIMANKVMTIEALGDTVKRVDTSVLGELLLNGPGHYLVGTHG
jgi:cell wall-associated NlpC family hydrolase